VAVDWVSRLIYWADASNQLIGVITMNTSAYWRPVVDSGLTEPQDVAVNAIDRSEIIIGTHIVIVNSRRLERPQKRSRGNQLIPKQIRQSAVKIQRVRQAGIQSDGYVGWCLEFRRGGKTMNQDRIC